MNSGFSKNKIIISLVATLAIVALVFTPLVRTQAGLFYDVNQTSGTSTDPYDTNEVFTTNLGSYNSTSSPTANSYNLVSCTKDFSDIPKIMDYVGCTITNSIIPLLFAFALLVFIVGVIRYVIAPDGSDDREEGRSFMLWGVVGLFVMVAVWGLVGVIKNTLDISASFPPQF